MKTQTFDLLTPHVVIEALESALGVRVDGTMTVYPSYVNRVYGATDEDGRRLVVKFYRPGRWTLEAIEEEHLLVTECADHEIPVVAPIADEDGETLHLVGAVDGDEEVEFPFAAYLQRGGRSFDAESDEDWLRLGGLVGRVHEVAVRGESAHRIHCTPLASTTLFLQELREADVVHPDCRRDFFDLAESAVKSILPLFDGVRTQRLHGDCHRGNILDRTREGLLLIDFDDMMVGPAVQDLWLLLPDKASASRLELELILEGYTQFRPFDRETIRLIEPLRLMRMIYYLAWSARQRDDRRFRESFPAWGTSAFWVKEIEDVRTQLAVIADELAD